MAKNFNFLHDIQIKRGTAAYGEMLTSPALGVQLYVESLQLVRIYQARVGRKTGKLRASAKAQTARGGKNMDRTIGKVTIAGPAVVAPEPYKGKPFYYGVYHEVGNKGRGRSRKRKYGTDGYEELRQSAYWLRGAR